MEEEDLDRLDSNFAQTVFELLSPRLQNHVDDGRSYEYDSSHGCGAPGEHDVPMDIEYRNPHLEQLVTDDSVGGSYGVAVIRGYRKVINFIKAAKDERDFRRMRSLNFEKLKGDRDHQYSMRINKRWRLIVEIKPGEEKNVIEVIDIEDYH
jgi:proteic killer suppression protein